MWFTNYNFVQVTSPGYLNRVCYKILEFLCVLRSSLLTVSPLVELVGLQVVKANSLLGKLYPCRSIDSVKSYIYFSHSLLI